MKRLKSIAIMLLLVVGICAIPFTLTHNVANDTTEGSGNSSGSKNTLPILVTVSLRTGQSPSGTLLPMGMATLLGGMADCVRDTLKEIFSNIYEDESYMLGIILSTQTFGNLLKKEVQ